MSNVRFSATPMPNGTVTMKMKNIGDNDQTVTLNMPIADAKIVIKALQDATKIAQRYA